MNKPSLVLKLLEHYVQGDILQLFGKTGTGKSKFVLHVALEAAKAGMKVFYYDTEGNLSKADKKLVDAHEPITYKYDPRFNMLRHTIFGIKKGYDIVIVDSTGYPILVKFATMSMNERGSALLDLIAINGHLKEYCKTNDAIAIAVTQPESDFAKGKGYRARPFGDKSLHATKEIWEIIPEVYGRVTRSNVVAFRSREVGRDTQIAKIMIDNTGTKVVPAVVVPKNG